MPTDGTALAQRVPVPAVPGRQDLAGAGRALLECATCGHQASVIAGTIFQDTRTPLTLWFRAMWWMTNQKTGVSALGLQRVLGLGSYKTAWSWLHKLRRAMVRPGRDRLTDVEVDEAYVGGVHPDEGSPDGNQGAGWSCGATRGPAWPVFRLRRLPDASGLSPFAFIQDAVASGVSSTPTGGLTRHWSATI